jgi:hypothetical protein
MIFEPVVSLAQTVHLSCVKISNISKMTETSIHLSLVTKEYYWVRPKWILSLWYVWCKPCTYLAPILTLSLNGMKWDSTWPTSPRGSIGCIQNYLWAYGMFGANRAPILHQDWHYLQTDWTELPLEAHHLGVPLSASKMIYKPMLCLTQTAHLSCTDANTVSKRIELRFHMTHVTEELLRVRLKWFLSPWYFRRSRAPILRQD